MMNLRVFFALLVGLSLALPSYASGRKSPIDQRLTDVGTLIFAGKALEARTKLDEIAALYRAENDALGEGVALMLRGISNVALGNETTARSDIREAAAKLSTVDSFAAWLCEWMLATLDKSSGAFESATSRFEEMLATLRLAAFGDGNFTLASFELLVPVFGMDPSALGPLSGNMMFLKPILLAMAELITRDSYGEVLVETGRLEDAEVQLTQAMKLGEMFGGLFDSSIAAHVGDLRRRQWRFDEARENYKKALAQIQPLPMIPLRDEWIQVSILGQLADIEQLSGNIDQALAWNDRALTLVRSRNPKREASVLEDRGHLLMRSSKFDAAERTFLEALKIAEASGNADRKASILANLGALHMFRGTYGTSVRYYEQAVEHYQQGNNLYEEAAVWLSLSEVYMLLNSHDTARETLQKARQAAQESKFKLAEQLVEVAAQASDLMSGTGSADRVLSELSKWWAIPAHGGLMMPDEMRLVLQDILGLSSEAASSTEPNAPKLASLPIFTSMSHFVRGKALLQQGNVSGAREHWLKGLDTNPSKDLRSGYLAGIGATYWREGNEEEAIHWFQRSLESIDAIVRDVPVEEMLTGFLGTNRSWYYELAIAMTTKQRQYQDAFELSERARARAFLQTIGNTRIKPARGADEALVREAEALRTNVREMEQKLALGTNAGVRELEHAKTRYEAVMKRVKVSNPEYASLTYVEPLSLNDIRKSLPADASLISYYVSREHVHAWVVDRDNIDYIALPAGRTDLARLTCWARQLRTESQTRGMRPENCLQVATSEDAFKMLFAPLRGKIRNSRLFIVPHNVLHYVPFAALRDPETGRYLLETYTLTHLPSASALRFLRAKETPISGGALVVGNPTSESRSLAGAEREARAVARMFGATPLIGKAATRKPFFELDGTVDLIHVGAHGHYDAKNPLFSGIELADGRLEVLDILGEVDLSGVNLVVLSACRSAVGNPTNGDEIVGLTRAVLYAGSPGVISTLWDIDDPAAAALMETFYRCLQDGMNAPNALREGQLALLRREPFRDPAYWGAFILSGDPQGRWKSPE